MANDQLRQLFLLALISYRRNAIVRTNLQTVLQDCCAKADAQHTASRPKQIRGPSGGGHIYKYLVTFEEPAGFSNARTSMRHGADQGRQIDGDDTAIANSLWAHAQPVC